MDFAGVLSVNGKLNSGQCANLAAKISGARQCVVKRLNNFPVRSHQLRNQTHYHSSHTLQPFVVSAPDCWQENNLKDLQGRSCNLLVLCPKDENYEGFHNI